MKVKLAHLRDQGIDFAVFFVDARSRTTHARDELLASLVAQARSGGLRIDRAALAFQRNGQLTYYGAPDLVKYLGNRPPVGWNREMDA